jgi:ABC-type sugar transport system substrate-binding protein
MNRKLAFLCALVLMLSVVLTACSPNTETTVPATDAASTEVVEATEAAADATEEVAEATEAAGELTPFQQMEQETFDSLVGYEPPADKDIKIGALMITMANPFWVTFADGLKAKGEELGITVDVLSAPTEGDIASQLATCETMVTAGYDILLLYPITENNLIPCIVKATEAGIPVLEPNQVSDIEAVKADGGEVTQLKSLDFVSQGRSGAQYIVDQLGSEGGKVAIIEGLAAAPQSMARRDGAKEVFESSPNIELVTSQTGDWDRTVALNAATNIIQAHPDIRGFYCANDVMALAVVEAAIAAGIKDQVIVVGTDYIEDAKTSIKDGLLNGTMAFSPFVWGEISIMEGVMIVEGKTPPSEIPIKNVLVTIDNVDMMEDWK